MAAGLCLAAVLSGCQAKNRASETEASQQEEPVEKKLFAMDTYMTLRAYGDHAGEAVEEAAKEIEKIEELASTELLTSEVSVLNREQKAVLSDETAEMVDRALQIYEETDGAFDITVYPVVEAWGFFDKNYRVPSQKELEVLLKNVGSQYVKYDEKSSLATISNPDTRIDLGGIAKGYASDQVMEIFQKHQVEHAIISLGGNVKTLNKKPDGSSWKVAINDPKDKGNYLGVVEAGENEAVITSGGYERYFEQDGKTYHHIIDPSSGCPAESGLSSVTIVSRDGMTADALSTALFVMGKDKAAAYWRKNRDVFDAVLVLDNGEIFITEGLTGKFQSEQEFTIIK